MKFTVLITLLFLIGCSSTPIKQQPKEYTPDGIIQLHILLTAVMKLEFCKSSKWGDSASFKDYKKSLDTASYNGIKGSELAKRATFRQTPKGTVLYIPYKKPAGTWNVASLHTKPTCSGSKPIGGGETVFFDLK